MKAINKNGKVTKVTTHNKEYKIHSQDQFFDLYWDECTIYYPKLRRGFGHKKKRQLMMYQVRMYKTWKHNRKTRWK